MNAFFWSFIGAWKRWSNYIFNMKCGIIENVLRSTLSYPNETSKECIQFLNERWATQAQLSAEPLVNVGYKYLFCSDIGVEIVMYGLDLMAKLAKSLPKVDALFSSTLQVSVVTVINHYRTWPNWCYGSSTLFYNIAPLFWLVVLFWRYWRIYQ